MLGFASGMTQMYRLGVAQTCYPYALDRCHKLSSMTTFNPATSSRSKIGRKIFAEALKAVSQDKKILNIPLIAFAANLVVFAIGGLALAMLMYFKVFGDAAQGVTTTATVVLAVLVALTHVLSQAAVMVSANERFEGREPSIKASFGVVSKKFLNLTIFGLFEATIGLILRAIANYIRGIGQFIRIFGGLAWGVSTYFAIPMIVFENQQPVAAISQSAKLIKAKWGNVLRGNVLASAVFTLAWIVAFAATITGIVLMITGTGNPNPAIEYGGIALFSLSVLSFFVIGIVSATVMSYVKVALYRFATDKPVVGLEPSLLSYGFQRTF